MIRLLGASCAAKIMHDLSFLKFGRSSQLIEKMQSALDCLLYVGNRDRFRGIVTDAAGSTQKDHCARDSFRHDHGIMTSAAHHPMRLASCLEDCLFYFIAEKRIHCDGVLDEPRIFPHRQAAACRKFLSMEN